MRLGDYVEWWGDHVLHCAPWERDVIKESNLKFHIEW